MSGPNAAIAQAAANAGFDVSDWDALSSLISAVRSADRLTDIVYRRLLRADCRDGPEGYRSDLYPDRWNGVAAYKSDIYPDRWHPERAQSPLSSRPRLRTVTKSPDLPLRALLRRREDIDSEDWPDLSISSMEGREVIKTQVTGANCYPLGQRSSRKHKLSDDSRGSVPFKISKTEDIATKGLSVVHDGLLVELSDSADDTSHAFVQPALLNRSTNTTQRKTTSSISHKSFSDISTSSLSYSRSRAAQKAATAEAAIKASTTRILEKVRHKLQTSITNIQQDRERLSNRWEADEDLKQQKAMRSLTKLNDCLGTAEEALYGAVEAVDQLLW